MFQRPARPLFAQLRSLSIFQHSSTLRSEWTRSKTMRLAQTTINRIETTRKFSTENDNQPKNEADDEAVEGQRAYLEMLRLSQMEPMSKYQMNLLREREEAAKKKDEEPSWKASVARKRQRKFEEVMRYADWTYKAPASPYNGMKLSHFMKIAEYRGLHFNRDITGERMAAKIESDDSWRRKIGQPWGLEASPFSDRVASSNPNSKQEPKKKANEEPKEESEEEYKEESEEEPKSEEKDEPSETSENTSNGNFLEGRRYDTGLPARPRHTSFPDREGSNRNFDRPQRPYSGNRQEDSRPRELNPELRSSYRPSHEGYNSDRRPRREYNSDRPYTPREYNSERPSRDYNSDRPYTPREYNPDRPSRYPPRDFSRPPYDPSNRPSYNSDRPSKYFAPNSRPYNADHNSGERSLNRSRNPESHDASSSSPAAGTAGSEGTSGSEGTQGSVASEGTQESSTSTYKPHNSYQTRPQKSYPPDRPNPFARDYQDKSPEGPWSPWVRPLSKVKRDVEGGYAGDRERGGYRENRSFGDRENRGYGDRERGGGYRENRSYGGDRENRGGYRGDRNQGYGGDRNQGYTRERSYGDRENRSFNNDRSYNNDRSFNSDRPRRDNGEFRGYTDKRDQKKGEWKF